MWRIPVISEYFLWYQTSPSLSSNYFPLKVIFIIIFRTLFIIISLLELPIIYFVMFFLLHKLLPNPSQPLYPLNFCSFSLPKSKTQKRTTTKERNSICFVQLLLRMREACSGVWLIYIGTLHLKKTIFFLLPAAINWR